MRFNLCIVLLWIASFCSAQNGWIRYNTTNGLASNAVNDVLIENNRSIWVATNGGLTHINSAGVVSFNTSNSTLNSNRIKALCLYNGSVYMTTDSGLTYYTGRQFINYTPQNGLLSNNLRGMDTDRLGNLWLASPAGVSRYDGVQFHHDTGRTAFSIAVDTNNNVYIQKFTAIFNIPNAPPSCEIFNGISWFAPTPNFGFPMAGSRFKRCRNGQMVVYGNSDDFYAELSYPYNLSAKQLVDKDSNIITDVNMIEIDPNSTVWMGRRSLNAINLFKGSNGVMDGFILQPLSADITCIDVHDGMAAAGSNQGVYIAQSTITPISNSESFETNELSAQIDVNGPLFYDFINNRAGFEYPKNSNINAIYGAQLMIAIKDQNDSTYGLYPETPLDASFENGPVGNSSSGSSTFYRITRQEINSHINNYTQPSYQPTANIVNWPVVGDTTLGQALDLAEFVDVDGDNCYAPLNGDYPFILGDQAVFWMNHPFENHKQLEVHNMIYRFNSSSNPLDKTVFLRFSIINRSNVNYDSVRVGFYLDANIGYLFDDYMGCDSAENIGYFYNSDVFDESRNGVNGYGLQIPAVGFKFLSDSMDSHMRIGTGTGPTGAATNPQDWINYMHGKWKDGNPLKYGGNGYNSAGTSTVTTKHIYSGDPQNQLSWSELNPGGGQASNGLGDRRSISSIPTFSLQPNARKTIDMAVNVTQRSSLPVGNTVGTIVNNLNNAAIWYQVSNTTSPTKAAFINCTTVGEAEQMIDNGISLYPNPTASELNVVSSQLKIKRIQLFDSKGQSLESVETNALNHQFSLEIWGKGLFHLKIELENGRQLSRRVVVF